MKRIVFSFIILLFASTVFAGKPICRIRHNGVGNVLFKYVSWDPGSIIVTGEACLNCHTPGWKRCVPPNANNSPEFPEDFDSIDKEYALLMFSYLDDQVEAKNFEGSHQVVVQVEGENFKRIYNVKWELGPKGEGMDRFWRTDLTDN